MFDSIFQPLCMCAVYLNLFDIRTDSAPCTKVRKIKIFQIFPLIQSNKCSIFSIVNFFLLLVFNVYVSILRQSTVNHSNCNCAVLVLFSNWLKESNCFVSEYKSRSHLFSVHCSDVRIALRLLWFTTSDKRTINK